MNLEGIEISGHVFTDGKMRRMSFSFRDGILELSEGISSAARADGTLIPAFVNAHTHIGDSFVSEEPEGDIRQVFGPGGFKHTQLGNASESLQIERMRNSIRFMKSRGTSAFVDFREGGLKGIQAVPKVRGIKSVLLGRPENSSEALSMLDHMHGISASAVSDQDLDDLKKLSEAAHRKGKLFAIHFSERVRESIEDLLELRPSILVHCIEASDSDLQLIAEMGIPVVVAPRSNVMFGKRPDYSRFFRAGISTFLGTDNVMTVEPDMFTEISFMYHYQRSIGHIDPEKILNAATGAPASFLESMGIGESARSYVYFPNVRLTAYEIVTRGHMRKNILLNSDFK